MFELIFIALGLAMDAFAVAVCKGLSLPKVRLRHMLIVGLYFGIFQGVMPLAGWLLSARFAEYVQAVAPWIAFGLLVIIGGKMIWESRKQAQEKSNASLGLRVMLPLAIATSIDALATGVTFAFLQVDIIPAVLLIGVITLVMSMLGVKIGSVFGLRFKSRAELVGGIILIGMGVKILIEHLAFSG